jgi:Dyp-type peroxidase family
MAVDLRDTNIDPARPEYRKMLENLQANILKPHGRKESDHLVVRFAAGPETVRAWIREFARREVTSAQKQLDETGTYHDHGTRGGLVASLALSAKGYEALGLLPEDFGDSGQAFRNGMKRRGFSLLARNRDPPPGEWEAPYQGDIHALVSLSHDSAKDLAAKTHEVSESLRPIAEILTVERGTVLRNARGDPIEHFGYVDARSQPLFLQADLDTEKAAGVDAWDPSAPLGLVLVDDPFASDEDAFGSYLVFRKLQQDVVNFDAAVKDLGSRLGVDEARAGALVVGRFKDGTPVTLRPWDGLGPVNNFEYLAHDRVGNRCPYHAHIRKANQRGANPFLNPEEERSHRIVRRGIPYGVRGASSGASAGATADGELGLLFQAFQGNIARQFEFIQRTWVDNPNFPEPFLFPGLNTGDDALIGQHPRAAQKWPRTWGRSGRFLDRLRFNFGDYVRLRGGEYFFAPSLSFLKNL